MTVGQVVGVITGAIVIFGALWGMIIAVIRQIIVASVLKLELSFKKQMEACRLKKDCDDIRREQNDNLRTIIRDELTRCTINTNTRGIPVIQHHGG